ncbi:ATP-binding cassette domain-containing protein [Scatolibacter rhodanostii]|uniref:ATP-binding cassette domain-containing protein n=1 Tax=Scatolibacter rhodanostii TaxID=2014781 RepID=UPI000C089663|nr:ATP-binding cassette domain-containing protein [Scatolibacter rhodanostii]
MKNMTIAELLERYPFVEDYFQQNRLQVTGFEHLTFEAYLQHFSAEEIEDKAIDIERFLPELETYIEKMLEFLGVQDDNTVQSLTIIPGTDKNGNPEKFENLTVLPSQIISIVGPTGSGKSRLLADIEWAAQGDTPTGRSILINDKMPDPKWRYSANNKLVAQLSQNMNFVMDLRVGEFLEMHAQSRMVQNPEQMSARILEAANHLAGEKFLVDTPVTSLSGGQSRALMIADTAILSTSPIVLIDEIENAGIDRRRALELLVSEDKIVLMATHDPLLALMADRRIVIQNGGIHAVLTTTEEEKSLLLELDKIDGIIQSARRKLREGSLLTKQEIFK